jgi:ADP-ribose pyrophosphatase
VTERRRLGWVLTGRGAYVRLVRHHLAGADGPIVRDRLHHPGSVVIVPIIDDDVLLIRQWRESVGTELLEAPAGLREPGETAEAAATRECEEEVGHRPGRLTALGHWHASPGISDETMAVFVAEELTATARRPDGPEERDATVVRLPIDDAVDLAASGGIPDLKTTAALLATAANRRRFASIDGD